MAQIGLGRGMRPVPGASLPHSRQWVFVTEVTHWLGDVYITFVHFNARGRFVCVTKLTTVGGDIAN